MKYIKIYLLLFTIIMFIGFGIYFQQPIYRGYLLEEDSTIENLSAIFYFISFFIGVIFFIRSKTNRRALKYVSAISLLGFLDELSFGERLFNLKMPKFSRVKIDGVHDLFDWAYTVITRLWVSERIYVFLFALFVIAVLIFGWLKYRFKIKKILPKIYDKPPFILFSFFVFLILIAMIIDLEIIEHEVLSLIEELLEMNSAIALLFCNLSLYKINYFKET